MDTTLKNLMKETRRRPAGLAITASSHIRLNLLHGRSGF